MRATVAWQATTVAAIGLLVGLPLGVLLGRFAWNLFATELGVVPEPVAPAVSAFLVIPATLLLANLVALGSWPDRRPHTARAGSESRVRWPPRA